MSYYENNPIGDILIVIVLIALVIFLISLMLTTFTESLSRSTPCLPQIITKEQIILIL